MHLRFLILSLCAIHIGCIAAAVDDLNPTDGGTQFTEVDGGAPGPGPGTTGLTFASVTMADAQIAPSGPAWKNPPLYSTQLTVSGGVAPYTFSLVGGALPDNFSLDSTGELHGIPTTPGSAQFRVRVTDSQANVAEAEQTLRCVDSSSVGTGGVEIVTSNPLPRAKVGLAYQASVHGEGGVAPYGLAWSCNASFPDGVGLGCSGFNGTGMGTLSLTPTTSGLFVVSLGAANSTGGAATKLFVLFVAP